MTWHKKLYQYYLVIPTKINLIKRAGNKYWSNRYILATTLLRLQYIKRELYPLVCIHNSTKAPLNWEQLHKQAS